MTSIRYLALVLAVAGPARAQATNDSLRRAMAAEGIPVESVIAVHRTPRHILVDTHINPSAGTIVVLSHDWKPITTLPGWVLRILPGGTVLYQRNNVHFAPTHWAELWTWDPATNRDTRLYPNAPWDSVRRAYVDTVKAIYQRAGPAWFKANNHHMDAERFDTRLGDTVVVSPSGRAIAFAISFGGSEGSPAATPPLEVVVACRGVGTKRQRCSEQLLAALSRRYAGRSVLEILDTLAGIPRKDR